VKKRVLAVIFSMLRKRKRKAKAVLSPLSPSVVKKDGAKDIEFSILTFVSIMCTFFHVFYVFVFVFV
jgi:hypothetical protein